MRKSWKRMLGAGVVGSVAYAAWRAWNAPAPDRSTALDWSTAPFPFPPVPRPAPSPSPLADQAPAAGPAWVAPNDDGGCPATHPIKAKLGSGIYHVPGGANYARTKPDRCYATETDAVADGLRAAKA